MNKNSNSAQSHEINFEIMPKRFKVWDKREKVFCDNPNDFTPCFSVVDAGAFIMDEAGRGVPHTQFEIIQSTGIKDKNGVEIFEGDIIKYNPNNIKPSEPDSIMLVYFHKEYAGFAVDYKGKVCMLENIEKYCEVIGDIFENPELLEEEK